MKLARYFLIIIAATSSYQLYSMEWIKHPIAKNWERNWYISCQKAIDDDNWTALCALFNDPYRFKHKSIFDSFSRSCYDEQRFHCFAYAAQKNNLPMAKKIVGSDGGIFETAAWRMLFYAIDRPEKKLTLFLVKILLDFAVPAFISPKDYESIIRLAERNYGPNHEITIYLRSRLACQEKSS